MKFKKYLDEASTYQKKMLAKATYKKGDKVRVPHKGKMVDGKIVRLDKGRPGGTPYYVVYIGEPTSIEVPVHVLHEAAVVRSLMSHMPQDFIDKKKLKGNVRQKMNKDINKLLKPTYFKDIPLGSIFKILEKHGVVPLQEDATYWSGFLTGGVKKTEMVYFNLGWKNFESTSLVGAGKEAWPGTKYPNKSGQYRIISNAVLALSYFKMPSGNYEVIAYVS